MKLFTKKALTIGVATAVLAVSGLAAASHHANNEARGPQGPNGKGAHHRGPIEIAVVEQRLNEKFDTADVDNSGELSAAELATVKPSKRKHRAGRHHGPKSHRRSHGGRSGKASHATDSQTNDERAKALFAALDTDQSGQLSPEEFSPERQRQARRELRNQHRFSRLDQDQSNSVNRAEFSQRLQRLQAADADGNGLVTRQELRSARKAHRSARQATQEQGS